MYCKLVAEAVVYDFAMAEINDIFFAVTVLFVIKSRFRVIVRQFAKIKHR